MVKGTILKKQSLWRTSARWSRECDNFLHWLVKGVLDDLTENVCNWLLNLFVDAHLDVLLGVNIDEFFSLVTLIIEDFAVAVLVQVQHVRAADKIAVTSFDWMVAFMLSVFCTSSTLSNESSGLTNHLFLDVKLVAAEVSWYLECLSVVSHAGSSRSLTEITWSGSFLVGLKDLDGDNSLQ